MSEKICFSFNNWDEKYYPDIKLINDWIDSEDDSFETFLLNPDYVIKNQLIVFIQIVDQSITFNIVANKDWIKNNCPELLEEENSGFINIPDATSHIYGMFDFPFTQYNINREYGTYYVEDGWDGKDFHWKVTAKRTNNEWTQL